VDANGCELCLEGCPLLACIQDGTPRESQVFLHHKLGHRVPISVRTSPIRDDDGIIVGAVEIFTDNSSSLQILKEFEKLKHDAYMDALTAVGNRRYGEMSLATRIFELHSHHIPFGVLFMDIDHFKRFNDDHGHKTGDDVLVMVAKSIALSLRKIDVVARWGGEEFIVFLPGASYVVLMAVAERIRILIENSFIVVDGKKLQVTVSIGATLSRHDDSAESAVQRADELMYRSKDAGRNRVTSDEPTVPH
jgi:diguanylate cyclase (GGDEF)-like protein